jgi:hypothetical protein
VNWYAKGSTSLVVVGVDASHQSLVALVWAAEYARATSARLRAVAALAVPNDLRHCTGLVENGF